MEQVNSDIQLTQESKITIARFLKKCVHGGEGGGNKNEEIKEINTSTKVNKK